MREVCKVGFTGCSSRLVGSAAVAATSAVQALIDYLLQSKVASGAYNACAPEIVRNAEFTQILAQVLGKPAMLRAPEWVVRLALGEMSVLLLGGQRLTSQRSQEIGFSWRYPELHGALRQLLS